MCIHKFVNKYTILSFVKYNITFIKCYNLIMIYGRYLSYSRLYECLYNCNRTSFTP